MKKLTREVVYEELSAFAVLLRVPVPLSTSSDEMFNKIGTSLACYLLGRGWSVEDVDIMDNPEALRSIVEEFYI